jgi:hypothetical protein
MTTTDMGMQQPEMEPAYPIRLEIERPEPASRILNFPLYIGTFIRSIILIPHFIILYFFQILAGILYLVATVAILFSGRYPEGLFRFYVGYTRWTTNVYAYLVGVLDEYPPFSTDHQEGYPCVLDVDYVGSYSRLLNFPIFGLIIKSILLIPHFIVVFFLVLAAIVVIFIIQFAVLFTGSFPIGMYNFLVGVGRWSTRITGYLYALTDKYPPFSLS